jgi:hypothetical protein
MLPMVLTLRWFLIITIVMPWMMMMMMCSAFPDHLQGRGGCLTELSTDEIIMNQWVIPYEKSKDPNVKVVAISKDGVPLESPVIIHQVPMTFEMMVLNPNGLSPLQYVMDATPGFAAFVRGQCDGQRRVTGVSAGTTSHRLTIHTLPEDHIQVWAGWATGRGAVTLTNYFQFIVPAKSSEL